MSGLTQQSPLRLGMVGGGEGAFIGAIHRIAARIDNRFELVAGALSSDAERAKRSAKALLLAEDRSYTNFQDMAKAEAMRDEGIDAVSIVTPNHMHAPVIKAFLNAGIHVICDKPLTVNLEEALSLENIVRQSGKLFILTHNYTGYPMIRQAQEMVDHGDLGHIRIVQSEYVQDWLTAPVNEDNKQAGWRTDPQMAGAGAIGDIGTHAFNLACFVSGLAVEQISADLSSFVAGRMVDDNAHICLRFNNGARGTIWASQVAPGHENSLKLRIYGDKGGLEWSQEEPNYLWFTPFGQGKRLITRSGTEASERANRVSRTPGGHPEGYLEGFATIYREAADAILAHRSGDQLPQGHHINSIAEGVAGMRFIDACQRSSKRDAAWISFSS